MNDRKNTMNAFHAANDQTAARLAGFTEQARRYADAAEEVARRGSMYPFPGVDAIEAVRAARLAESCAAIAGSDTADAHAKRARDAAETAMRRLATERTAEAEQ